MRARKRVAAVWASVTVLAAGGCGSDTHATEPGSPLGGSATDATSGASGGGSPDVGTLGGSESGSTRGGATSGGTAAQAGSAPKGGNAAQAGATSGGSSAQGGSGEAGEAPAVDREWALWTMPNPVGAGLPNPAKYDTTTEPLLVHDLVTGLIWPRALMADYHDHAEAVATCEGLSLAGYDDWRLPTLIEYHSLLDWTHKNPAIDTAAFPDPGDRADNLFWTASPAAGDPLDGAWVADFAFISAIATHPNVDRFPVRCVRGGASPPAVHYVLEADTVFDVSTGLTWERHASKPLYTAADGAAYCDALELGGKTDWRLPGVGELATLVNVRTSAIPMLDREAFPDDEDAIAVKFWGVGLWALDFWGADFHHYSATDTVRVRCVR